MSKVSCANACAVVTHNRLVTIVVHLALHVRMRVCMCIFLGDWFALFDALGLPQTCVKSEQTINVYVYKHDMLACIANLVHGVRHRWTFQNVRFDQRRGKHKASEMFLKRLALELLQPTIVRRVSYLTDGFV